MNIFSCAALILNAWMSLFINISGINSSFKNLPSHLKVELLLFGDSKLSGIDNNLTLKASIKYILTTIRFSVPLLSLFSFFNFKYIHSLFFCLGSTPAPLHRLFSLLYLRNSEVSACAVFSYLFFGYLFIK